MMLKYNMIVYQKSYLKQPIPIITTIGLKLFIHTSATAVLLGGRVDLGGYVAVQRTKTVELFHSIKRTFKVLSNESPLYCGYFWPIVPAPYDR
jgi:hypothetical protein